MAPGRLGEVTPPPQVTDGLRSRWPSLTVLLGLGAVGALLRITGLGPSSLWLDDAWVALSWRSDTVDELLMVGVTAPGFVLLERTVFAAVGFSAVAGRRSRSSRASSVVRSCS